MLATPTAADLVVLDASSAVAVLLDAAATEHATIAGAHLLAPTLLPYEVANVVRRLRNAGSLSGTHAAQALADFASLPIAYWPWPVLADRVWQLGGAVSSYDAAFVALAEHTGATLVTRDARLGRAPGARCRIEVHG